VKKNFYPDHSTVFKTPKETAQLLKNKKEHEALDFLNKIVRGEIAAVEAYSKVIEKFPLDAERFELRSFKEDHQKNVDELKKILRYQGEAPSDTSGAWGTGVIAMMSMAAFFGDRSAVSMLIEGEEHGLSQYSEALNFQFPKVIRTQISETILPLFRINIGKLRGIANVI
jgi:hypothetical protein